MRTLATIILTFASLSAQAKETFYRCAHDSSKEEISMAIQGDATIVIRSQDGNRTYFVSEASPLTYKAQTKNEKAPEAYSSLELDRLTGELRIQERIPHATTKVLAEVCRKNISTADCKTMMSKVSEADAFLCGTTADGQCPRWLAGVNTYRGTPRYVCRATQPQ